MKPGLIWAGQEQSQPEDMGSPLLTNNCKYVRKKEGKIQLRMYSNCLSLTKIHYLKITKGRENLKIEPAIELEAILAYFTLQNHRMKLALIIKYAKKVWWLRITQKTKSYFTDAYNIETYCYNF